jgi:hypothetical protein
MMPVQPQIQKNFLLIKLAKRALKCNSSSTHERLLSESNRLYMLAFNMYVIAFR